MINYKKSKIVRIGSWLLEILSRDMKKKKKNQDEPTPNYKKIEK